MSLNSPNMGLDSGGVTRPRAAGDAPRRERRQLKRSEQVLATSSTDNNAGTGSFRLTIPSSRLRVKVAVGYWSNNGIFPDQSLSTITNFTPYVLDEWGAESAMRPIAAAAGQQLPYALDLQTAADVIVGEVAIVGDNGPPAPAGNFKVVVTWEPTDEMSAAEWEAVKEECVLTRLSRIFGTNGA